MIMFILFILFVNKYFQILIIQFSKLPKVICAPSKFRSPNTGSSDTRRKSGFEYLTKIGGISDKCNIGAQNIPNIGFVIID